MNAALLRSVFGSGVRLRPAKDAFESRYGVMVEFLDEDGSIRDFEGLEREDALMAALYLSTLATEGLSDVAEVSGLYHDAFRRLDGCVIPAGLVPANIIAFPASSEAQPPKTILEEDPTGGTPVHPVPPVGIVEESGVRSLESGEVAAEGPAL